MCSAITHWAVTVVHMGLGQLLSLKFGFLKKKIKKNENKVILQTKDFEDFLILPRS